MKRSHIQLLAGALLLILLGLGCEKSAPEKTATAAPASDTIARLHWLGKKRLAAETNAAGFMKIWNLPESARLEDQTLDKLATAPWRLLGMEDLGLKREEGTNTTVTAAAPSSTLDHSSSSQKLRPLLQDLVQEESYVEVHAATNGPVDLVLAIRLSADRAHLWQTNLAAVLKSLGAKAGGGKAESGKAEKRETGAELGSLNLGTWTITSTHSGEWTLVAFGSNHKASSSDAKIGKNGGDATTASALQTLAARIEKTGRPFTASPTNYWVDLDVQLARVAEAFSTGWTLPTGLPQASLTMIGDGENVRTLGELRFHSAAPIEMEPWNIPTELVHDPLIGFMAVRGIRPALKCLSLWDESRFGITPNQAFFWAQQGQSDLRFFAMSSAEASNQVYRWSKFLLQDVNSRIAMFPNTTNLPFGTFQQVSNASAVRWRGLPYVSPSLNLVQIGTNAYVLGGLSPNRYTNQPAPNALLRQFKPESNLILYQWERTQPSAFGLIQMSQAARLVFGRNRLSLTNNPAQAWLVAVNPLLGTSGTSARLANSRSITFSRTSTIGLTGIEMHLLVDWLESPEFPRGMFSLSARSPHL